MTMASSTEDDQRHSGGGLDMKTIVMENLMKRESTWRRYGNYHVFCGGCILIGPVRSWWWLLEIYVIIVTITFIVEYEKYKQEVFIIGLVLFLIVFGSSWKVLLSDPGIIKRPKFSEAIQNAEDAAGDLPPRPFGGGGVHREKFDRHGDTVRYSYCFRCHVWRPPQSGHCTTCGCCQLNWDHHCPVYGGCVAKKNIAAFYIMTVSIPIYVTYLFVTSCFAATYAALKDGKASSILSASIVADEIVIGIVLSLVLPPLLTLLPCEQEERDPPPDNQPPKTTMMRLLEENSRRSQYLYGTKLGSSYKATTTDEESGLYY